MSVFGTIIVLRGCCCRWWWLFSIVVVEDAVTGERAESAIDPLWHSGYSYLIVFIGTGSTDR